MSRQLEHSVELKRFLLDDIFVDIEACELRLPNETLKRLEPKAAAVLAYMALHAGAVVTKNEIRNEIWGGAIVVDEALQRIISLLRKALNDNARNPRYIETIPKKGYRLLVDPVRVSEYAQNSDPSGIRPPFFQAPHALFAIAALCVFIAPFFLIGISFKSSPAQTESLTDDKLTHADTLYARYRYEDNENAIALYRDVIDEARMPARGFAGLANSFSQRYFLWSNDQGDLKNAIESAQQSVRLAPNESYSYKALGLAQEYAGDLESAMNSYLVALEHDPQHWPSTVNIGDIHFKRGKYLLALNWFTRAHKISDAPVKTASKLGKTAMALGRYDDAARWFSFILERQPLHQAATAALARAKFYSGDERSAMALCEALLSRLPNDPLCGAVKTDIFLVKSDWRGGELAVEAFAANAPPKWEAYVALRRGQLAYLQGDREGNELRAFIERFENKREHNHTDKQYWALAAAYSILGDNEKSLSYLKAAHAAGWSDWSWDKHESAFENLREEEKFFLYIADFEMDIGMNKNEL